MRIHLIMDWVGADAAASLPINGKMMMKTMTFNQRTLYLVLSLSKICFKRLIFFLWYKTVIHSYLNLELLNINYLSIGYFDINDDSNAIDFFF